MSQLTSIEQALLALLSDNEFHSGDALAKHFAVSRAAISKWVKHINTLGIKVFSVKGKGYQLAKHIRLLDVNVIKRALQDYIDIDYHVVTGSTNDNVKSRLASANKMLLSITEQQVSGRGRRGREWVSPFGQNLYMSLGVELNLPVAALSGLSIAIGLSLAETLVELGYPAQLKWPNDIYLQGKKLGGILVELEGAFDTSCRVIMGIGLNVNMQADSIDASNKIEQEWISLSQFSGRYIDRSQLCSTIISNLVAALHVFSDEGLNNQLERWSELDYFYNQPVKLMMPNNEISGIVKGIDPSGALLLETDEGKVERFIGGEISVRANKA
ncbi:bifunctional biotin--[acetyl-CoA-carboxylase] ligase/biotin operon repressor BirA [Algibacillus agarilyticus]|uniref:bifunctional biotin--[acetyl-CoA-carboxylase] ligase/biotin operon repressor BirA n=1 Tax=Algibacillus agarilyticus TaxID=2234133 RepID=UPI000DD048BE|nr:bifunctional biotin--[acetyl-CoA-carboxylase] ligase/biotin operon repressor BirA [Algibacillus agarilyticus]